MKRVVAVYNLPAASCCPGKFDGCLDRFRTGICEEYFVQIGHVRQKPLREHAGQCRYVHLNKIGKIAIDNAFQRLAQNGVIAADRENSIPAQQVEIPHPTS